jgi:cytidylate kinase
MIIAIDGPSGAGKSTLGKRLAKKLNLLYLDTGAMYRAVAFAVLQANLGDNQEKIIEIAENSKIELIGEPESLKILLNGEDISTQIRTNEVGQMASIVSTISEVRKILVKCQQELGKQGSGCVLDGRDIGTVVFPNADLKFFLTAKPESRARRRYEEDLEKGIATTFEETLDEINKRDKRDVTRADSPLTIAEDAIVIDTSELNLDEVFAQIMLQVEEKRTKVSANLT